MQDRKMADDVDVVGASLLIMLRLNVVRSKPRSTHHIDKDLTMEPILRIYSHLSICPVRFCHYFNQIFD